jgi:hypothetical protein
MYAWDGENRLIRVEPAATPASGDKKLDRTTCRQWDNIFGRRLSR